MSRAMNELCDRVDAALNENGINAIVTGGENDGKQIHLIVESSGGRTTMRYRGSKGQVARSVARGLAPYGYREGIGVSGNGKGYVITLDARRALTRTVLKPLPHESGESGEWSDTDEGTGWGCIFLMIVLVPLVPFLLT
jgi:hypothetical protein